MVGIEGDRSFLDRRPGVRTFCSDNFETALILRRYRGTMTKADGRKRKSLTTKDTKATKETKILLSCKVDLRALCVLCG